ncbi:MAG TPA: hypothetical protein VLW84_12500 [Terriglobales bacterium]|nr:hypothetical protein [Terriglobales bacterium]
MDEATRTALLTTAHRYFDMAAKGDVAGLRQVAVPSVAADFGGIENAVKDNQTAFSKAQATPRPPFLLKVEGNAPLPRAEFLCGVFGPSGQTRNSAIFVLNGLPPGDYAVVIFDVATDSGPHTLSLILQQQGNDWRLAGFYCKALEVEGHDANWFAEHAADFKAKGEMHNAWFYYLEARELAVPVPFMSTLTTDQLYDQMQKIRPADLPPADLAAAGKTFKLTALFPTAVGNDLDVEVKYQVADISNTQQTFQDNMALIKALLAKYPELHNGFSAVIARAVDPSGHDFGSLLAMKDAK